MKRFFYFSILFLGIISTLSVSASDNKWKPLFGENLSDASYNPEVWGMTGGVLAAVEDESIWTKTNMKTLNWIWTSKPT